MKTFYKYIIIFFILIPIIIVNLFNWQSVNIGLIFGLAYLYLLADITGNKFFGRLDACFKYIFGLLVSLSLIIILGTGFYYVWKFDLAMMSLLIIGLPLILILAEKYLPSPLNLPAEITGPAQTTDWRIFALGIFYLALITVSFKMLFSGQTTASLRSPWEVIPSDFFIVYFLATLILILIIFFNKKIKLSLLLTSLHFFLSLSVGLIIYKIGFGFDPFIHRAAEKFILNAGVITPKTFYYIGQYSLVTFLARLLQIPVELIDKLILPLLSAIYLPAIVYFSLSRLDFFKNKQVIVFLSLLFLAVPYAGLTVTTPQSLANLFLVLVIFLSLNLVLKSDYQSPVWLLFLLASASLLIHPLAGIPAFIFLTLLIYLTKSEEIQLKSFFKKAIFWEIVAVSSVILPLIFLGLSFLSGQLTTAFKTDLINLPRIDLTRNFDLIYDLVYFYGHNSLIFIFLLAVAGIVIIHKNKNYLFLKIYLTVFIVLITNYVLLKVVVAFPSLVDYEQANYPARVLEISFYLLIPFFLVFTGYLISRAEKSTALIKISALIFICALLTGSLYFAYPRHNKHEIGRGYSVSAADLEAIRLIDRLAEGDYLVLANQAVGAAALREAGFKKYYDGLFYYSIPTGSPTYQIYLKMVYEAATKKTAQEAADLAGVKQVYLVINDYWTDAQKIIEEAMFTADDWQSVADGKIYVFSYKFQ